MSGWASFPAAAAPSGYPGSSGRAAPRTSSSPADASTPPRPSPSDSSSASPPRGVSSRSRWPPGSRSPRTHRSPSPRRSTPSTEGSISTSRPPSPSSWNTTRRSSARKTASRASGPSPRSAGPSGRDAEPGLCRGPLHVLGLVLHLVEQVHGALAHVAPQLHARLRGQGQPHHGAHEPAQQEEGDVGRGPAAWRVGHHAHLPEQPLLVEVPEVEIPEAVP